MLAQKSAGQKALPMIEIPTSGSSSELHQPSDEETPQASPAGSPIEIISPRSRASSIFSTGTKTSIGTLAQPPVEIETSTHSGPVDVLLGRRNFRITARPGSILSISSFDHPAPPYSENAPTSDLTVHDGDAAPRDVRSPSPTHDEPSLSLPTPVPRRSRPLALSSIIPTPESDSGSQTDRAPSPPSPPLSPLSSSTNALSAHYTSVVRTIDANHRAEIHRLETVHAAALDRTRHDIDAAYRPLLRAANARADAATAYAEKYREESEVAQRDLRTQLDFTAKLEAEVLALQQELDALRTSHASAVLVAAEEKDAAVRLARNEVEDVWEGRWRDRMRLAAEEVRAAHEDGAKVGIMWQEEVHKRWPNEAAEMKEKVDALVKSARRVSKRRSRGASGSS